MYISLGIFGRYILLIQIIIVFIRVEWNITIPPSPSKPSVRVPPHSAPPSQFLCVYGYIRDSLGMVKVIISQLFIAHIVPSSF